MLVWRALTLSRRAVPRHLAAAVALHLPRLGVDDEAVGEGVAVQILAQRLGIDLPQVTRTVHDLIRAAGEPRTPGGRPTG